MDEPIIIRRKKHGDHPHHGGAWKIAYADFVTAMMAFFLLLWLISMTTPEQKQGLANYFSPPNVSVSTSGSGGVLGGNSPGEDGAKKAGSPSDTLAEGTFDTEEIQVEGSDDRESQASLTDLRSKEDLLFQSAAASIRQAWQALPDISEISDNLLVSQSEEGLEIMIVDQVGKPMFPEGSKFPYEATRRAIAAIAPVLQKLPNQIRISGHTSAGVLYPDTKYGPWELSADRANITRSVLGEFGLSQSHVHSVVGRSTEDPFFPNDPFLTVNSRIKITVLHAAPPYPAGLAFGNNPVQSSVLLSNEVPTSQPSQESSGAAAGH